MKELIDLRKEIDDIDIKLVELFEQRMHISMSISQYKKQKGIEVLDKIREKEVIENCKKYLTDKKLADPLEKFLISLMDISKEVQNNPLNNNTTEDLK